MQTLWLADWLAQAGMILLAWIALSAAFVAGAWWGGRAHGHSDCDPALLSYAPDMSSCTLVVDETEFLYDLTEVVN